MTFGSQENLSKGSRGMPISVVWAQHAAITPKARATQTFMKEEDCRERGQESHKSNCSHMDEPGSMSRKIQESIRVAKLSHFCLKSLGLGLSVRQ